MHPVKNTRRPLLALSAAAAAVACGALAGSASADPWWQHGPPHAPVERATSAGPAFAPFVVSPDQQDRRRAASATSATPAPIHVLSVARSQRMTMRGWTSRQDVLRGGVKIGTDVVSCAFARVERCSVVMSLPGGTLALTFRNPEAGAGSLKIVGGTGTYAHAGGIGAFRNLDKEGSRTAVTLRLT
jgi:hypothetical protein